MNMSTYPNEYGRFVIGLKENYTDISIEVAAVYAVLTEMQAKLHLEQGIFMSSNCFESTIVMGGQIEPHLNVHFINYPLTPMESKQFRSNVQQIVETLMKTFKQNRVVIEFPDELLMLQETDSFDQRILERPK
jgi:diadenosine tetraphosphate (Ap4A) HIT family hydrolase